MTGDRGTIIEEECYAAALAALPGMGPASLCRILADATPREAWGAVRSGLVARPEGRAGAGLSRPGQLALGDDTAGLSLVAMPDPGEKANPAGAVGAARRARARQPKEKRSWVEVAAAVDPPDWWERYSATGIAVTWRGRPDYPAALVDDPQPPGVLFWRGSLAWLERRRVAIIGTRSASGDGRAIAFEMGRDLAAAGVCVISGLALGIDGACHAGVLNALADAAAPDIGSGGGSGVAGPVGVAASGVDVPYPRQHHQLWEQVAQTGAVVSESPPGRAAQAWMFPSRNRLIAGLAELVVVVESHRRGGSLITAEAAIDRGVEVRVVPGPVRSPASEGSNQLLYDGPGPVRDAGDVLDVLGIGTASARPARPAAPRYRRQPPGSRQALGSRQSLGSCQYLGARPPLGPEQQAVLDAMPHRPAHLEQLMMATGLGLAGLQRALDGLVEAGVIEERRGWWCRR